MADSTMDSEEIMLFDQWGPVVPTRQGEPRGGFTGSDHFNVATRVYMPGETRVVDNLSSTDDPLNGAGVTGQSIFRYLLVGTQTFGDLGGVLELPDHVLQQPNFALYSIAAQSAGREAGEGGLRERSAKAWSGQSCWPMEVSVDG